MTAAETIATGLENVGSLLSAMPGIGPWIAALAKLGATIARAGGTPQHITMIDGEAIVRGRATADARLDQRAEARDAIVPSAPDTEPSIYADPNDDERDELGPGRPR